MKPSELRNKNVAELQQELIELNKEQFNLRMLRGSGQDVKPHLFNKVRRNIARVKTVLTEVQAGAK